MAEQILSQEEIDALLTSMEKGDVEVESEEDGKKKAGDTVEAYDLTLKSLMSEERFYALEEVFDRFKMFAQNTLSTFYQKTIEVKYISSEMVKYEDFMSALSSPTIINIFTMDPLIGSCLFVVEPNLVFTLIENMFGGEGNTEFEVRDFTSIEKKMMATFALNIFKDFELAWEIVTPTKLMLKGTETKPEYVRIAAPYDVMLNCAFSVSLNEIDGNVYFCLPCIMLEPIRDKLTSAYMIGKEIENAWRPQLQELLKDAQVTVTGELGKSACTVENLLSLEKGDVMLLDKGPHDPLTINVEGVIKYYGFPGVIKGNRAVQITRAV